MLQVKITKQIAIYLNNEEIELFKLFREHQNDFQVLIDNKVFEIKNGKAILNFDKNGKLRQIDVNKINWRN